MWTSLCPLKTGPAAVRVFGYGFLGLGRGENDEGIEVHGGAGRAFIRKQGKEGTPVAEICRRAGTSQATHFNWKKRYGGLLPDEMCRRHRWAHNASRRRLRARSPSPLRMRNWRLELFTSDERQAGSGAVPGIAMTSCERHCRFQKHPPR